MSDRLAMLKELVGQHPAEALPRYSLAMEHANLGNVEDALREFARLLEQHPDYTAAYQMSAQVLARAGRNDEARKLLQDGIAAAGRTGNAHAQGEMQQMLDELA